MNYKKICIAFENAWADCEVYVNNLPEPLQTAHRNAYNQVVYALKLRKIPDYGEKFTLKEWKAALKNSMFTPDDGDGYFTDDKYLLDGDIFRRLPEGTTHVVWFNK